MIYGLSAVLTYVEHFIMATVTLDLSRDLRQDLSRKINRVPMSYFSKVSYGDILSRVTNDVSTLQQALANSLPSMISAATQFVGCLVMMFVTEWRMALAAVAVTLVGFLIMAAVMLRSQKYFSARQENLSTLNGYIEEIYSGHDVVRLSRADRQVKASFGAMNSMLYDAEWRSQFLSGIMQPLMTIIGNLGYVVVCVLGSALAMSGEISFGVILCGRNFAILRVAIRIGIAAFCGFRAAFSLLLLTLMRSGSGGLEFFFGFLQRLLDEPDDEFFLRDFPAVLLFCGDEILQPLVQLLGDFECESLSFRHGDFSSFEAFFEYQLHIITQSFEAKLFLFCHSSGVQFFRDHSAEILLCFHGWLLSLIL